MERLRQALKLRQLIDVSSRRPDDGQVLVWSAESGKWEPRSAAEIPELPEPEPGFLGAAVYTSTSGVVSTQLLQSNPVIAASLSAPADGVYLVQAQATAYYASSNVSVNTGIRAQILINGVVHGQEFYSLLSGQHGTQVWPSVNSSGFWVVNLSEGDDVDFRLTSSNSSNAVTVRSSALALIKVAELPE